MQLTLSNAPPAVLVLGLYTAALPIALLPVLMLVWQSYAAQLTFILLSYCSSVLTFIGAVRWAFIIARSEIKENQMSPTLTNLGMAVAPSIVGWVGLLLQGSTGLFLLVGGFALGLMQDIPSNLHPPYYRTKNVILEVLSIFSLLVCHFIGQ